MPTSENYSKEITIVLPEDTYFIANLTADKRCMYENNICNAEVEGSASVSSFQGINFTSQPDEAILYDTAFAQNETSINFWGTNIHNGTVVEIIYNNNGTQDDQSLLKISADTFGNCTINNVTIAELFKQDAQPHFYSFGITFSGPIHVWVDGELVAQTDNVQSTYLSGYQISIGSFITGDIMSSQNFNSLSVTNQLWGNDVNELIGKHCGVPPVEVYDSPSSVINYYNITTQISNNGHTGTITPTSARVAEGNNQVFNIVAGEGNYIYFIKLDDVDVPGVAGNYLSTYQYTLENISENHIIRVAFMNTPAPVVGSYYTLVSDPETRIPFHIDNTPLANFGTSGADTESITINNQSVVKNTIKELSFGEEYSITTSINDNFLRACSSLTSIDLSGLSNVTSIGTGFLRDCSSLTSVDLSALSNVTTIGYAFLQSCSSLTSIDLSPLSNVTSIIDGFLSGCSSLTSIDLSPLSNVTSVRNTFLNYCSGLTSVDLSPLSNVTTINNTFLQGCSSLTSIDLSPLSNVTSVGHSFLSGCTSLTSVTIDAGDWSTKTIGANSMGNVNNIATNKVISNTSCELANNFKTKIGQNISNWTVDCPVPVVGSYYTLFSDPETRKPFHIDNTPLTNFCTEGNAASTITINGESVVKNTIKELSFADEYSNTTVIPQYFLRGFPSLSTVDLSSFSNVTSIGDYFLNNCSGLTSVDLSALSNVTSIGNYFLSQCLSLTSIELSALSNVTSIGTDFLHNCSSLTSVDLSPFSNVSSIGDYFLYSCTSLTSVDLSGFSNVTSIGDYFLTSCSSLTSVDLSPFSNVTTIGASFLRGCSSLTSVDLSPFSNVTTIGASFLRGCSSLTSVDLSPFSNVSSIGDYFLTGCSSLTSIDLSPLSNVTTIGDRFLNSCTSLTSIDLSPLSNVTTIGYSFLDNCTSLTSVTIDAGNWSTKTINLNAMYGVGNLSTNKVISNTSCELANNFKTAIGESISSWTVQCPAHVGSYYTLVSDPTTRIPFHIDNTPLANFEDEYADTESITINGQSVVKNTIKELCFGEEYNVTTSISYYFLCSLTSLSTVDLSPFSNVTTIKDSFLRSCSSLTSVDLSLLSNVTSISNYFLSGCSSLTSIDLSPLSNVTSIGTYFINGCQGLTSIYLSPLSNVTSIGNYFLSSCTSLTSVDLSPFSNVTTIGANFLHNCSSLTSVDLSGLSNVTSINNYFLQGCSSLTSIDLSGLSNVTSINHNFLYNCYNLTSIDLSSLSNVTSIGIYFLTSCTSLTSIDLSPLSNVISVGHSFLHNCTSLTSVTIDAGDWSTKTVGYYSMQYVNNIATNKVISNTSCELANNFKTKIGAVISNWTVQCPV